MNKKIVILSIVLFKSMVYAQSGEFTFPNNNLAVVGDNVNVRALPDITAKIVCKMKITDFVEEIRRTVIESKTESNGTWIYIDTGAFSRGEYKSNKKDETIKGWVFGQYLANMNDFNQVTSFKHCILSGGGGDLSYTLECFKDGKFIRKVLDPETRKWSSGKGQLYKFRNVIMAVLDNDRSTGFLYYLDDNGVLTSSLTDESGKPFKAKLLD